MGKRIVLAVSALALLVWGAEKRMAAQDDQTRLHVTVNLVQLNVAVTDRRGDYVTNLRPEDFVIMEDNITERIASFEEGNGPTHTLVAPPTDDGTGVLRASDGAGGDSAEHPQTLNTALAGADVFVLFDTSNSRDRGFVFAQDAFSSSGKVKRPSSSCE